MRSALQRYNLLLQRSFIDIPTLELPRIETKLPDSSVTLDLPIGIGPSRKFVRRIFSRGSWNLNGRYYGGWWQQVGKGWRSRIFINDEPTVEVDFKGMHVAILGIEAGAPLIGDPYELPLNTIAEFPAELQRKVVKKLLLTAINAKDYKSAFASCRESFPTGHAAKQLTNDQLSKVLNELLPKSWTISGLS